MNKPIAGNIFSRAEKEPGFWMEDLRLQFMEDLAREMKHQGINRTELAKRVGTSPAYITKILRGDSNFTLQSMVKLSFALGSKLCLHMEPIDQGVCDIKVLVTDSPLGQGTTLSFRGHRGDQLPSWGTLPSTAGTPQMSKTTPLAEGDPDERWIRDYAGKVPA